MLDRKQRFVHTLLGCQLHGRIRRYIAPLLYSAPLHSLVLYLKIQNHAAHLSERAIRTKTKEIGAVYSCYRRRRIFAISGESETLTANLKLRSQI